MNTKVIGIALLSCALALCASGAEATGGKFKVIHSFAGGANDGANPYGGVAPDGNGNFYVATDLGGQTNSGTLTLISTEGAATVLHSFLGNTDGQNADGTPLFVNGVLWGTTTYGGNGGCGTVYIYTVNGAGYTWSPLECASHKDFAFPFSGIVYDGQNLLGTALNGNKDGAGDNGGLYYLYIGQVELPYCEFHGSDGAHPYAGVTAVKFVGGDEAFYVAASAGGSSNLGTVAQFDTACNVSVLHNFAGGSDGATPTGTLWYNNDFFLYGTTRNGGGTNLGTVFRMDISGGNYTVLHTFQGICCGNSDGSFPASGLVPNPKDGMLYGTTINGGNSGDLGTVFKIDPSTGAETVVHAFSGSDGAHPYASLYIDAKGKVYGTTLQGGAHNLGAVFSLATVPTVAP